MKHFTKYCIAIVVALVLGGSIAARSQPPTSGYDESTEYFDSKKCNKWHNSPNFKKALTILNDVVEDEEIDYADVIALLENEIKQHPSNGYALCNLAIASINDDDVKMSKLIIELLYGNTGLNEEETEKVYQKRREESFIIKREALEMLEKGISLLPASDKENLSKAYITCGNINKELEEVDNAIAAYEHAAATMPCYKSYHNLLLLYLEQGDNAKSLYYASKLGDTIDTDNEALVALAQVYIANNDLDHAEALINKAIVNDDSDQDAYQLLINMLIDKGRYKEALDKTIEVADYLSVGDIIEILSTIYDANDDNKAMIMNRLHELEAEALKNSDNDKEATKKWDYCEGVLYYANSDFRSALTCFDRLVERKPWPSLLSLKADCHYMLGDAPKAFDILNYALRMPEKDVESDRLSQILSDKIKLEMLCGMTDEQIYDAEIYCKAFSDKFDIGYEAMARGYINKGQYAKALEICDEWVERSVNIIDSRYMHAYVLMLWGKNEQAREEFQDIINDESCTTERKIFALFYMGETEKSKTMLDEMARNSELVADATELDETLMQAEVMSFYNLACAYSLHGDIDRALHFLERHYAEEDSATDFGYAILDDELNNARKDPRFMEIVNRYKQQWLDGKLGSKK